MRVNSVYIIMSIISTIIVILFSSGNSYTEIKPNESDLNVNSYQNDVFFIDPSLIANQNLLLNSLSSDNQIPKERFVIVNKHEREFPIINKKYLFVKVIDTKTYKIYEAMLDLDIKRVGI
jgi:hypothetical protein